MANILLANEFGSGLGHLNHLVMLAKRFDGGHRLVFALDDTATAAPVLRRAFGDGAMLVQGPRWAPLPAKVANMRDTHTLADPFDLFGLGEVERLGAAVDLWSEIIGRHAPDLIVADAAPSLRLAAGGRVPMVVVGSGYTVPPPGRVLPPIRPWQESVPAEARAVEAQLLAAANAVRAARGGAAVDHWADLFGGDDTFVCTLPGFDPYRAHRTRPQTWPYVLPLLRPGPPVAERDGADVFAYLPGNHPALGAVIDTLNRLGEAPQIYVSNLDPKRLARACQPHVAIHTTPADFAAVLPRCRLLIHHGGLATAFAGLAAGAPQLALPMHLEHTITAQGLADTGAARALVRQQASDTEQVLGEVESLRGDPRYAEAASSVSKHLIRTARPEAVEDLLAACQCYLAEM